MGQAGSADDDRRGASIDDSPSADLLQGYHPASLGRTVYAMELDRYVATAGAALSDADSLTVLQRAESVCTEMESVCHHSADPRVAIGLMRGVMASAASSPVAMARFVELLLAAAPDSTYHSVASGSGGRPPRGAVSPPRALRSASVSLGAIASSPTRRSFSAAGADGLPSKDDAYRHPLSLLITRTIQAGSQQLLDLTLQWITLALGQTAIVDVEPGELEMSTTMGRFDSFMPLGEATRFASFDQRGAFEATMTGGNEDAQQGPPKSEADSVPVSPLSPAGAETTDPRLVTPNFASSANLGSGPRVARAEDSAALSVPETHSETLQRLLDHGVIPLLNHAFTLQDTKPVSAAASLCAARLLRVMCDHAPFVGAALSTPLPSRVLRRLRFTQPGKDERAALVDFLFAVVSFEDGTKTRHDRADPDADDADVSAHERHQHYAANRRQNKVPVSSPGGGGDLFDPLEVEFRGRGAVDFAKGVLGNLHGFFESVLACLVVTEHRPMILLRALRTCAAVASVCTTVLATPLPVSAARLVKLMPMWEFLEHAGYRDLCRLYVCVLHSDSGLLTRPGDGSDWSAPPTRSRYGTTSPASSSGRNSPPQDMAASSSGVQSNESPPLTLEVQRQLAAAYTVKLVERGDVDPVDLLHVTSAAMSDEADLRGLVLSQLLGSVVSTSGRHAVRVPRATRHWLRLVARIGLLQPASMLDDSLSDAFASKSAGLDVLLGIVEAGLSRAWVYEAVAAIQRLCTSDNARVRLLQQRNFHALLRTISPKGSGEQMLAASEAVAILRSMMTPSVLAKADAYLVDSIDSLLCQALSHCPLVNPRTHSVEATYIIAAQGVLQTVLELLLRRVRDSERVAFSIYLQLPLDRARELTVQSWYPVVQRTANDLLLALAVGSDSRMRELLDFGFIRPAEVRRLLDAAEAKRHRQSEEDRKAAELAEAGLSNDPTESTFSRHASVVTRLSTPNSPGGPSGRGADAAAAPSSSLSASSAHRGVTRKRVTVRMFQERWRLILRIRHASNVRVSTAGVFKAAFLQYNKLLDAEAQQYKSIGVLFASHVACIDDIYRARQGLEDDSMLRHAITIPESTGRASLGMWYTEDLETLRRDEGLIMAFVVSMRSHKAIEQIEFQEIKERCQLTDVSESRAWDALEMRHTQGARAIERLYDQRRHLEKTEGRFRSKIVEEYEQLYAASCVLQGRLFTESDALISRRRIHQTALDEFVQIRLSFYPVLALAISGTEERRRDDIERAAARIFAASADAIALLEVQREEEAVRRREELWASRVLAAFVRQCNVLALRHLQQRERALRMRLWHALCWQWHESVRAGVTLRLQADEDAARSALAREAAMAHATVLEGLRATLPLALQATEVRARRALMNVYALHCRYRILDGRLLRLAWAERQQRNAIAQQWFVGARNLIVPLSVARLASMEQSLRTKEIDLRAQLWIAEWHEREELKFDALQRAQTVERKAIVVAHRRVEERLLEEFVGTTHVLAIQHAAKGYRPPGSTTPQASPSSKTGRNTNNSKQQHRSHSSKSSHHNNQHGRSSHPATPSSRRNRGDSPQAQSIGIGSSAISAPSSPQQPDLSLPAHARAPQRH